MLPEFEKGVTNISILGYPKAGNTWFQVMLRMAMVKYWNFPNQAISHILNSSIFDEHHNILFNFAVDVTHNMPDYNISTMEQFNVNLSNMKGKKVVLLVRDPRDIQVSLYMHNAYREHPPCLSKNMDMDAMVSHDFYGLWKCIRFYQACIEQQHIPKDIWVVRYEDLLDDCFGIFKKVMHCLGFTDIKESHLVEAVEFGRFDYMRTMEEENILKLPTLAPPKNMLNPNAYKVREGKKGSYRKHFSHEAIEKMNEMLRKDFPEEYGYTF